MEKRKIEHELRRWFVRGCPYHSGVELLRTLGVSEQYVKWFSKHENQPPTGLKNALATILGSVDFLTLQVKTNLEEVNFQALEFVPDENQEETAAAPVVDSENQVRETPATVTDTENQVGTAPAPALNEQPQPKEEKTSSEKKRKQRENEPPEIKALREKAIPYHKKQSYLHAIMREAALAGKRKKAYQLAREIMEEVLPALDAIYDQIREWEKTGIVPPPPQPNEFKRGVEMMKKRENLRTRILKLNRLLAGKLDAKERQRYENERLEKQVALKEIEEVLENLV